MLTEGIYKEVLKYAETVVRSKNHLDIDPIDIAHDVIVDESFSENFKPLVQKYYYERIKHFSNTTKFTEFDVDGVTEKSAEELWCCKNCSTLLPKSYFQLSWYICNKCYHVQNAERIKIVNKKSYLKHHEKRKKEKREYGKKKRLENGDEIRKKEREYYANNKIRILKKNKKSYIIHREDRLKYLKDYSKKNAEKIAKQRKEYYENNKEKKLQYSKEYYQRNREKLIRYGVEYNRRKRAERKANENNNC